MPPPPRPEPDRPVWLTPKQVSRELHLSLSTVYRYIESGKFPGTIQTDRQIRIPQAGFDEYVRANELP